MKKALLVFAASFLLLGPTLVFAHGKDDSNHNRSKFELKIESDKDNDDDEDKEIAKLEIDGQEFAITGEITAILGNTFTVLGQTITIDPSQVSEFKQKGIIKVGNVAKVEGVIVKETKLAQEVNIIGTGQGRFKFEVTGLSSLNKGPSPSASPTIDSSPSPSPSPSPEVSPSATPSANVAVKIKANGSLNDVIDFIKQILSFLEGLI